MEILRFIHNHFIWFMPALVFVSILLPKISQPTLSSPLDPYYHHAHSLSYIHGDVFNYPVFSLVNVYQTDLWFLYHLAIAVSVVVAEFFAINSILANKIFHAALGAGVFLMIYLTARELARRVGEWHRTLIPGAPYLHVLSAHTIGVLAVIFLFLPPLHNMHFMYRILINERPHLIAIMLTLAVVIALLRRSIWWLVFIGILSALFYSFSPIILLPLFVLAGVVALTWKKTEMPRHTPFIALFTAVLGLGIGILLHPTSYGYFIAGVGQTTLAILHSLVVWTGWFGSSNVSAPVEMFISYQSKYNVMLLGSVALALFYLIILVHRKATLHYSRDANIFIMVLVTGLLFTLIQIIIPRTVEYGLPFFACALAVIIGQLVWPIITGYHRTFNRRIGEIGDVYRKLTNEVKELVQDVRLKVALSTIAIIVILGAPVSISMALVYKSDVFDDTRYAGLASYLATIEDPIVLTEYFHEYPLLIYSDSRLAITSGFDSRFIYFYDPELSNAITTFWGHTYLCHIGTCDTDLGVITETLTENGITHILVLEEDLREKTLLSKLQSSEQLTLVYSDEDDPSITLYQINL